MIIMLNENLPLTELQTDLIEYIYAIDVIKQELFGPQKKSLLNSKSNLGRIHHALNVDKYQNSDFRYHLLEFVPAEKLKLFFRKLGWSENMSNDNDIQKLIYRASRLPWSNSKETRIFVEHFGYEQNLIPSIKKNDDHKIIVENHKKPLNTLWKYQSEIYFKAIKYLEARWERFIIQMPTGSGKTRTAMEIISNFINGQNRQVLWLADREELCTQAIKSFNDVWEHLGHSSIPVYRFWSGAKFDHFEKQSFIVSTYSKLRHVDLSILAPDLIICDEAHNAIATTYKKTLEKLIGKETRIMGLTATPIRGINSPENNELTDFFLGNILSFDIGDDDNVIDHLQKNGYLSYCKTYTVDSNVRFRINKEILDLISNDKDLPDTFLREIANNNQRNIRISELLIELGKRGMKTLYFAPTIHQSKLMCALLIDSGYDAAHVDYKTPHSYRHSVVEKFRNNEIKILCNNELFSIGFDDPKIDAVVIGRPTTSIVLHTQMIGRGMRGPKMGGTESFELYRIDDHLVGLELADDYFKHIWEKSV